MRKTCSSRLSKKRKIKWKNKKVFHLPLERTGRLRLNCWKCSASSARVIDRNYIGERAGRNFPLFPSSNVAAAAYKYTLSLMASKYKAPSMRHLNSSSLKGGKWIPSRFEHNQKSRCLKDKKKQRLLFERLKPNRTATGVGRAWRAAEEIGKKKGRKFPVSGVDYRTRHAEIFHDAGHVPQFRLIFFCLSFSLC